MQKVDRLRLKLDKAAKRHAVWAVARPTERSRQMYDESRQSLLLVAGDFAMELSDEYMREAMGARLPRRKRAK